MSEKFEKQVISMLTEQKVEIKEIKSILKEHSEILESHEKKLNKHDEDIESLKRSIINIEDAVTTKIPALFDAFSASLEKHQQYDEKINSLEATVENHSARLNILELANSKNKKSN